MGRDGYEKVEVASREALRRWLAGNCHRGESVWLVTYRKQVAERHVPWDAVVEEALCFGWIDSLPRKLDADRTMVLLAPRKPGSAWSGVNKARVEKLFAAGLIEPPGLAAIEAAKADGSWTLLDSASALEVPEDLAAAFARHPGARDAFEAFPPRAREPERGRPRRWSHRRRITPSSIRGQRKPCSSSSLANWHSPVPSHRRIFTRSARLARNTQSAPENGSPPLAWTSAIRLAGPVGGSIAFVATNTRAPGGIMPPGSQVRLP